MLKEAILNAKVRAFIFRERRLKVEAMLAVLKVAVPKMVRVIDRYQAPFIFAIEVSGEITPISNLDEIDSP